MESESTMATLIEWLQQEIDRRHVSVREFARHADLSHGTLNRILAPESEDDRYPSLRTLVKLARYTGSDLCTLVALVAPEDTSIDAEARILVERIRRLTPENREIAENYILGTLLKNRKQGA